MSNRTSPQFPFGIPATQTSGTRQLKRVACGALFTNLISARFGFASFAAIPISFAADSDAEQQWVGTWSAGDAGISGARQYANQTLRLIVHTSIGGRQVRVRISNTFGTESLVIGAAHVGLRKSGARISPGTDRTLSFSGKSSFTIPAGALALSDPVSLWVPPLSDLAVSIYVPTLSTANTTHIATLQTNYVAHTAAILPALLTYREPAPRMDGTF